MTADTTFTIIIFAALTMLSAFAGGWLAQRFWRRPDTTPGTGAAGDTLPPAASSKPPPWIGFDLQRWQSSKAHVDWANALFADPRAHRMMEVLWSKLPLAPLTAETNYAAQQGRIQGYRECLGWMLELTQATPDAPAPVPADYTGDGLDFVDEHLSEEDHKP
jgi:hypothetical protein